MTLTKQLDESWDFRSDDTKISNHGFHTYPAMMIPQVARRIINMYGLKSEVLCDPFMGTGTSVLEAKLHENFKIAYGIDINPLARLIAKVKTTPLNHEILYNAAKNIINQSSDDLSAIHNKHNKLEFPNFKNIDFWFKPNVIQELTVIKKNIDAIDIPDKDLRKKIQNFLLVAFSEAVRLASNTRNSEFKLYRMAEPALNKHNPSTLLIFEKLVLQNIEKMKGFNKEAYECQIKILDEDTRRKTSIPSESVDIIVSSPPYGDSQTTVAYGQFSRLSLEWLGFESNDVRKLDRIGLGGIPVTHLTNDLGSRSLDYIIETIAKIDKKRAKQVLSFYVDFHQCVKEIDRFMKIGGYICFVVGNRTVKNQQIPTDEIIVELFQSVGEYRHIDTFIRNIPNKRMPSKNSPTNIKGNLSSTMNNEYIVIIQKK